jgi:general secretion pathway protein G
MAIRKSFLRVAAGSTPGGFTIVEVLVVILLISMLAVFIVPQYLNRVEGAKHKAAKAQIAKIELSLGAFLMDCGRYPEQSEGLQALLTCPSGLNDRWKGPYCKESQLLDPWGRPFQYIKPGVKTPSSFDIISYGTDGQPGGEGDNQDIYND